MILLQVTVKNISFLAYNVVTTNNNTHRPTWHLECYNEIN